MKIGIYGGSFNLFAVTMKRMGVEFTFVDPDCAEEELNAAFQDGHVAETHWEQVRDNDIFWVDKRAFVFRD